MGFWDVHGILGGSVFLLLLTLLPRWSMLIMVVAVAGPIAWLLTGFGIPITSPFAVPVVIGGWLVWVVFPRYLAAALATALYWSTNPLLCIFAWLAAHFCTSVTFQTAKTFIKLQAERTRRSSKGNFDEQLDKFEEAIRRSRAAFEDLKRDPEFAQWARAHANRQANPGGRSHAHSPPQSRPWWVVLGVHEHASKEEIKSGFREMLKRTHPDATHTKDDAALREVVEAYNTAKLRKGFT